MQSHLCPAMDPLLVQPPITRPPPPVSSAFQVCPDQTPMLLSTQPTLLLHPFIDLPRPPLPTPPCSGSNSRSSQNRLLCHLPPSTFPALPHTSSVFHCSGFVGVLSHPCLSIHTGPSVPEPGNSVPEHRRKMEDGNCHSLPPPPGGDSVPSVFPQPSVGALDHL